LKFQREFGSPNKRTFTIPPVRRLLKQEIKEPCLDPFPYPYSKDALEYLRKVPDRSANTVLYDPPYSQRQLKESYENQGLAYSDEMGNSGYWSKMEKQISRVLMPGGICIKFGWNSGRIYRGFEIIRILLVCHGGHHNDTIVTIQKKMLTTLEEKSQ